MGSLDYVYLKATLHALDNRQELYCRDCMQKYRGRSDEKQMTDANRARKHCETESERRVVQVADIQFFTCPGNFWSSAAIGFLEMQIAYEHGVLPFPGSLADQPAKVMDILRVIQAHKHEKMIEDQKRESMKARTQARGRNHKNLR